MKTTLFNFLTLRNPQTSRQSEKREYHVTLSADLIQRSHFYSRIQPARFRDFRSELLGFDSTFTDRLSINELRSIHGVLIDLYRELNAEKYRLSYSGINQSRAAEDARELSDEELVRLWDNYAHYLFVSEDESAVDILTSILVADKFLQKANRLLGEEPNAQEEADLKRLAKAKVILPIPLRQRVANSVKQIELSIEQRRLLENAHDRLIIGRKKKKTQTLKLAVNTATEEVKSDIEREFRSAVNAHTRTLALSLSDASPDISEDQINDIVRANDLVTRPAISRARLIERIPQNLHRTLALIETADDSLSELHASIDSQIEDFEIAEEEEPNIVYYASIHTFNMNFTVEETIPDKAFVVKALDVGDHQFEYYLTYHFKDPLDQIVAILGRISNSVNNESVSLQIPIAKNDNFQTFLLNQEEFEGLSARFELSVVLATDSSTDFRIEPFDLFETIPHFGIIEEDEQIDDFSLQPPPLFGVNKIGVADFRRVESEIECYVAGEVSHIQNIMASQYMEKVTRSFSAFESESTTTEELGIEHQSDSETTEKQEMQSEARSVLRQSSGSGFNVSGGISGKISGVSFHANSGYNKNSESSQELSTSQALTFAKSVTDRVQEKITQKRVLVRRSKRNREFENTHKHGYDNRGGEEHVVGIYRWVDKVYRNNMVNYGRRTMYEFTVPEPAKNFIRSKTQEAKREGFGKTRPESPTERNIEDAGRINRVNYKEHAAYYGADVAPPPSRSIFISKALSSQGQPAADGSKNELGFTVAYNEIEIPDGYVAVVARVRQRDNPTTFVDTGQGFTAVLVSQVSIAGREFRQNTRTNEEELVSLHHSGTLSVAISTPPKSVSHVVSLSIRCRLTNRAYEAWKLQTYNEIIVAYNDKLAKYEAELQEFESEDQEADLNPRLKRQVEKQELKRLCIEMITEPFELKTGRNHYAPAPPNFPRKIKLTADLDRHAALAKFLEQALDWELMSYIFYPYYYSAPISWRKKVTIEGTGSKVFQSFLTAGMARVVLPVREGFEDAFGYYLEAGRPWFGGGFVLDVKNDLYVSIADELATGDEETVIEKTWQTVLPTNLTILQSRAGALDAEGLPCKDPADQIAGGSSLLQPHPTIGNVEPGAPDGNLPG